MQIKKKGWVLFLGTVMIKAHPNQQTSRQHPPDIKKPLLSLLSSPHENISNIFRDSREKTSHLLNGLSRVDPFTKSLLHYLSLVFAVTKFISNCYTSITFVSFEILVVYFISCLREFEVMK